MHVEWRAIASDALARDAWRAIECITDDLRRLEPTDVKSFKGDLALYFAYLAEATGDGADHDRATAWLDAAIADAVREPLPPTLFGGVVGLGWTIEHLGADSVMTDGGECDDANADVDEFICGLLERTPWRGEYDLIGGLVGFGVYFLERWPRGRAGEGLRLVVRRLEELAEACDGGVRWHTPASRLPAWQRKLAPEGYYNLGVAHGVPGIVALLGQCVASESATPGSEGLLRKAMAWVLGQEQPREETRFVGWLAAGSVAGSSKSRLAWCYGDLGVAIALLSAACAAEEPEWRHRALEVAIACTKQSESPLVVRDAGLCHGTAGVAHLYNRLFQATLDERFLDAAQWWLGQTLAIRGEDGYGGYRAYAPTRPDGQPADTAWQDNLGLLGGTTGIGLALIAATAPVAPEWDRLLLASLPRRGSVSR